MFNIIIWYDQSIDHKDFPQAVGIMCINCGKIIGFLLDNQAMENFVTPFVKNMVLHHAGLSWIIQSNQKQNFNFQRHCPSWMTNGPFYNTTICSQLHGQFFENYVTTARLEQYNIMCSIEDHEIDLKSVNDQVISGVGIPRT